MQLDEYLNQKLGTTFTAMPELKSAEKGKARRPWLCA